MISFLAIQIKDLGFPRSFFYAFPKSILTNVNKC